MSDLTARDIYQLDQAAVEAASDVDALADDPETTLRLADRGPAVYAAQLTADLAAAAGERPMTLAGFAAWQTIRRVQERAKLRADLDAIRATDPFARTHVHALCDEVEQLRAQLEKPCGSCHPCTEYSDETWRAAGRKPPHVSQWDELRAELDRLRADLAVDDDSRLSQAEQRVRLAQGMAEDWAGNKDVVLASAGRALLNTLGGAR